MNAGDTKVELTTTTGMMMPLERYNRLSELEQYENSAPSGKPIVIVNYGKEIVITALPEFTLQRVGLATMNLIGEPGKRLWLWGFRDSRGCFLELTRPLSEMGFKPFERLFPDIREYAPRPSDELESGQTGHPA